MQNEDTSVHALTFANYSKIRISSYFKLFPRRVIFGFSAVGEGGNYGSSGPSAGKGISRRTLQGGFLFLPFSSCRRSLERPVKEIGGKGNKSWKWLPMALMLFCRLTTGRQCETPSKDNWQPVESRIDREGGGIPVLLLLLGALASWDVGLHKSTNGPENTVECLTKNEEK